MSRPVVSDAAERLYDRLRPYQPDDGDDNGWVLLHLCEALARMMVKANDATRHDDIGSGQRRMLSPSRAPEWELKHLLQYAGGRDFPPGLTVEQKRDLIADAPWMRRGTPDAIKGAIKPYLTGGQTVEFYERDGGAYKLTAITYTSETPDPDAAEAALRQQVPVGVILTYHVYPGWSIGAMEAAYPTIGDLEAAFPTIGDMELNVP